MHDSTTQAQPPAAPGGPEAPTASEATAPVPSQPAAPAPTLPPPVGQPWTVPATPPKTVQPAAQPAGFVPTPWTMPAQPSSRPGLVLGVISLIISGLALLGVIGLFAWSFSPPLGLPPDDFGPAATPLTGQLASVPNGGQVPAEDLTDEITQRLEDDGWDVEALRCPQVTGLGPGTVSVCHGALDGSDWAVLVFFEDAKGTYTLSLV